MVEINGCHTTPSCPTLLHAWERIDFNEDYARETRGGLTYTDSNKLLANLKRIFQGVTDKEPLGLIRAVPTPNAFLAVSHEGCDTRHAPQPVIH